VAGNDPQTGNTLIEPIEQAATKKLKAVSFEPSALAAMARQDQHKHPWGC
jgi:hypothetical protein